MPKQDPKSDLQGNAGVCRYCGRTIAENKSGETGLLVPLKSVASTYPEVGLYVGRTTFYQVTGETLEKLAAERLWRDLNVGCAAFGVATTAAIAVWTGNMSTKGELFWLAFTFSQLLLAIYSFANYFSSKKSVTKTLETLSRGARKC
jgi:hypothetical protein